MGMVAVGQLAVQRGLWKEIDAKRQKQLIEKAGLPSKWPNLEIESVLSSLQGDKKVKNGKALCAFWSSLLFHQDNGKGSSNTHLNNLIFKKIYT